MTDYDASLTAEELQGYVDETRASGSKELSDFFNKMQELEKENALGSQQRLEYFADEMQSQMQRFADRADALAEQAAQSDNPQRAENLQKTANQLREWASQRAESADAATYINKATKLANSAGEMITKAGGAFDAIDGTKMVSALAEGDYEAAKRESAGIIGGAVAAALAASALAGWPAYVIAAGMAAGGFLGGDAAKTLWDNLAKIEGWIKYELGLEDPFAISPQTNENFQQASSFRAHSDPLALDLDGDGLETSGASGEVLFDNNGDGIKHSTGWINGDDALLVRDLDGDGIIDSGAELFGDETVLSSGSKAANGYEALADLDSNGDGQIDANDAAFDALQIWQDANQDGISQASELSSLADAGIASIGTGYTETGTADGNGNIEVGQGTYTKTDGTQGETASFDFAQNPFYREFTDSIEVPEALQSLPNLQGSGAVRDLREAAALNSELATLLEGYAAAETRSEQMAMLDSLIEAWADSSDYQHFVKRINNSDFNNRDVEFLIQEPAPESSGSGLLVGESGESSGSEAGFYSELLSGSELEVGRWSSDQTLETLAKIKVLEVFNHQNFFDFDFGEGSESTTLNVRSGAVSSSFSSSFFGDVVVTNELFSFQQGQIDLIDQAYEQLKDSIYQGLLTQTRLKPYLDGISLQIDEQGEIELNYADMEALLTDRIAQDPYAGLIDYQELSALIEGQDQDWDARSYFMNAVAVDQLDKAVSVESVISEGLMHLGSDSSDELEGSSGNDIMFGGGGDDNLLSGNGNDIVAGGDGDDVVDGRRGNNTLIGGAGADRLTVDRSESRYTMDDYANTFDGGRGDDRLEGYAGSDTYIYRRGDGHDVINDNSGDRGRKDRLELDGTLSKEDLWFSGQGDNLLVSFVGTDGSITIEDWYADSRKQIEEISVGEYKLLKSEVDSLVSAMAAFDPPAGSGGVLTEDARTELEPAITAAWQPA
ncbi:hypothetical protein QQM79_03155 [Marinobacteraceae bacterium S3BR75-40.1]